jgi:protein O-GlcNAc transferase
MSNRNSGPPPNTLPAAGFSGAPAVLTLPQAMQQAATAYVRGEWGKADQLCRFILTVQAVHFDALSLLGIMAARSGHAEAAADFLGRAVAARPNDATAHNNYGIALKNLERYDDALRSYERALEINRNFPDAYYNQGNARKELKRYSEALESYERALNIKPDYAEAHINRGIALQALERVDDALDSYERALKIRPDYAEAHYNRGVALWELRRFEEALNSHERALEIKPDYAEAHNNRGVVLRQLQRLDEALDCYERALEIKPDYAEAHNNRGVVLQELRRFDAALNSYARALEIKPHYASAYINQGNALTGLGRFEDALDSYGRALALKPDYAEVHNNRGNALKELKRFGDALESFEHALRIKPDYAEACFNLGNTLVELRRLDEALVSYGRAIELKPGYTGAYNNRGNALQELHRLDEALESYGRALKIEPQFESLYGTWLHTKLRLCEWSELDAHLQALAAQLGAGLKIAPPFAVLTALDSLSVQRQAAQIWANARAGASQAPIEKRGRRERIRLGYFSADFHNHATAHLMAELFERHDRARFEVLALSFGPDIHDEMRGRLSAAFDRFVDVRAQSDKDIAQTARELGIDIAVDLKGFTKDERHGIFIHRAAPIQVNYLGYPGTTGSGWIDYLIADRTLIPEHSRPHYTEKVVYLPHSYQANDRRRPIAERLFSRAELGLPPTGFVFCCFNNSYKIMPAMFAGWMRILAQVEGSVLWLLEDNQTAVNHLRREAQARGVSGARLIFAPRLPPAEHLARHRAADLFLDTLPCNAHTTASDALWAGLPLLTCLGESFAARVAGSLLNAIGLPELITTTQAHYETLAIELATHPQRLAQLRDRLRANRLTAPLFDTPSFTRQIENAYTQMYERYQAGLAPDYLVVQP